MPGERSSYYALAPTQDRRKDEGARMRAQGPTPEMVDFSSKNFSRLRRDFYTVTRLLDNSKSVTFVCLAPQAETFWRHHHPFQRIFMFSLQIIRNFVKKGTFFVIFAFEKSPLFKKSTQKKSPSGLKKYLK